jgi:hypothetical protein
MSFISFSGAPQVGLIIIMLNMVKLNATQFFETEYSLGVWLQEISQREVPVIKITFVQIFNYDIQ